MDRRYLGFNKIEGEICEKLLTAKKLTRKIRFFRGFDANDDFDSLRATLEGGTLWGVWPKIMMMFGVVFMDAIIGKSVHLGDIDVIHVDDNDDTLICRKYICIVGVACTPLGGFHGSLSSLSATKLGSIAIESSLKRTNVDPSLVQEVELMVVVRKKTSLDKYGYNV
ncbi:acetyl-CoA C-acetyltransferase [Artemisia annua]|uniref:Acetyl-CoA C-acetyltransferase n=1 Tax=Artemisia annua TaxID=35608 RepID=A0A2U1N6C7_ARTAN|nr:acetyl-CoA C-acetyltransferase [Artemisia annua]